MHNIDFIIVVLVIAFVQLNDGINIKLCHNNLIILNDALVPMKKLLYRYMYYIRIRFTFTNDNLCRYMV